MPDIPRLNGVIRALEQDQVAFVGFAAVDIETAAAMASSNLDGVAFEMEHAPMSAPALRDALQYMLDRRQILDGGTLAPKVTPLVRIPPNGGEMNQWIAKQVLDIGVFGIIFPHVSTVEEARNAIGACRYPKLPGHPLYDPPGIRGDAPVRAARTGASRSRTTIGGPTSGRSRPMARSSRSSSARTRAPSRTCRGSCSRSRGSVSC